MSNKNDKPEDIDTSFCIIEEDDKEIYEGKKMTKEEIELIKTEGDGGD